MNHIPNTTIASSNAAVLTNETGQSPFLLVCEHASNHIPARYGDLGLTKNVIQSHAAWDPGAFSVAKIMATTLDARLVSSAVSRLVYDCNRPPESEAAIRETSEIYQIPANTNLGDADKSERVDTVYKPFQKLLSDTIAALPTPPVIVTIHSFTPIYNGKTRDVELGILHDTDSRLADAILEIAGDETEMCVERNAPYAATDGVMHTLKAHALPNGYLNVMIEIRNDLIANKNDQAKVATLLVSMLTNARTKIKSLNNKDAECPK